MWWAKHGSLCRLGHLAEAASTSLLISSRFRLAIQATLTNLRWDVELRGSPRQLTSSWKPWYVFGHGQKAGRMEGRKNERKKKKEHVRLVHKFAAFVASYRGRAWPANWGFVHSSEVLFTVVRFISCVYCKTKCNCSKIYCMIQCR